MTDIEEMNIEPSLDSLLEELTKSMTDEPENFNSDSWRSWSNRQKELSNKIENHILSRLESGYELLDSEIDTIIQSDLEKPILNKVEERQVKSGLRTRLEDRKRFHYIKHRQEEDRKQFLLWASTVFQKVKEVPDQYKIEDGQVNPNPLFTQWKKGFLTLKHKVEARVKTERSLEHEISDYKADERQSIFIMNKKLNEIYEDHKSQLEAKEEKKPITRLMSDETKALVKGV
jgi:hypothetical protein